MFGFATRRSAQGEKSTFKGARIEFEGRARFTNDFGTVHILQDANWDY